MSFSVQERINAVAKALMGGVLDSDPNAQYYESTLPFSFVINNAQVWSQGAAVKAAPAANIATARANCLAGLAGIVQDFSQNAAAVRLTPVPGVLNTFLAVATFGDLSSAHLDNWLSPQFAPQASGVPSFGYAVRLFDGDPNAGGVEVLTTTGATGTGVNKSVAWIWNYANGILMLSSDFVVANPYVMGFRYIGTNPGAGGGSTLSVLDEGVLKSAAVTAINFIGADVMAHTPGAPAGQVNVYIPAPPFLSHWNTADGSNGNQAVSDPTVRVLAHISTPSGGEGNPFKTGGWAGSNHDTTVNQSTIFTTLGDVTGFGGDSTMKVDVFDADGVTLLSTYTTPAITSDAAHSDANGYIVVTITNYGADIFRYKAHASVWIDIENILMDAGLQGGRYHVRITHTTDSVTDGNGAFVFTQTDVFRDFQTTLITINGAVIASEGAVPVTKHLSGVEYYILGSPFNFDVQNMNGINSDTSATAGNLTITSTDYGIAMLSLCPSPGGTGAANFIGWNNNENVAAVRYTQNGVPISVASYRYIGPTANISAFPADPFSVGPTVNSPAASVLIDTYVASSTINAEYFNDEARRENPITFPGAGTWNSATSLVAGEAMVFGGLLLTPNQTTFIRADGAPTANANWSTYKPNVGGANPNYSALTVPVSYGRRFTKAVPAVTPSFTIVFSGTFVTGNALDDMIAGNLEVYIYRIDGLGHTGPPSTNLFPLRAHVAYNLPAWDDGATLAGSGIREGTSAGNTINCTLGGSPATTGIYCVVKILNAGVKIDSMVVTLV